jgi:hypothetical protein
MLRNIPYLCCWVSIPRPFASLLSSSAGRSLGVVLVAKEGKLLVSSMSVHLLFLTAFIYMKIPRVTMLIGISVIGIVK